MTFVLVDSSAANITGPFSRANRINGYTIGLESLKWHHNLRQTQNINSPN